MVLGLLILALDGRADEIAAVEAVRKLGGQVTFEPLLTVNFNGIRLTDAGLKELKELKSLERLGLNGTQVTDAGLKELRELKSLQDLDLGGTQVTDAGLTELKQLKSLQWLYLLGTRVTDAGLKELKELKSLKALSLNRTQITDAGLTELKELKSLHTLDLSGTKLTDAGLKELKELKGLRLLHVADTKVTDGGLKELKELKSLQNLNLGGTKVTDAGLKELKELKSLQTLGLNNTKISDAGLKELKELKSLHTLSLNRTQITDAGLKELKELKSLVTLDVSDSKVTEAGLKELRELKSLQNLDVSGTKVTEAGLKELKQLKSLQTPNVPGTKVPDAGGKERDAAKERLKERESYWKDVQALSAHAKLDEAVTSAKQMLAIDMEIFGPVHSQVADSLGVLAQLHEAREDFPTARKTRKEILAIRSQLSGEKHWQVTDARMDLAGVDRLAALDPDERRRLREARRLDHESGGFVRKGEFREAIDCTQKAMEIYKQVLGEKNPDYAIAVGNLGYLYHEMGDRAQAKVHYLKALEIKRQVWGEAHPGYATALGNLAMLHSEMENHAQAQALLLKALEITKDTLGELHPEYATRLNNLGSFYDNHGDYARAEPLLQKASGIRRKVLGESDPAYATSLNNLAIHYYRMGDRARAKRFWENALEIQKHRPGGEMHPNYADTLSSLAMVSEEVGNRDRAVRLYLKALDITKQTLGETHGAYATTLNNLALIYQYKGDYDRAEELFRRAHDIRKKVEGESSHGDFLGLISLGTIYRLKGDYSRAESLYQKALEIQQQGRVHAGFTLGDARREYAGILAAQSQLFQATNRPEKALALLGQSMEVDQASLRQVLGFTAERAMHAFLAQMSGSLHGMISMAAADAPNSAAAKTALTWTLRRKAIVLDTLCRLREGQQLLSEDKGFDERVGQLRGLRQRLANLAVKPPPGMNPDKLRQEIAALRGKAEQLEAELNRALTQQHSERMGDSAEIDAGRVQGRLAPGAALVEVVRVRIVDFKATGQDPHWKPAHYFAFVLTAGNNPPRLIDLGPAEVIDQAVGKLREQVERVPRELRLSDEKTLEADFRPAAGDLYRLVFAPLRPALGRAKLVYLAADGELNRLAFEALTDPDGKYLVESIRFAYLSSGRDLLRAAGKPAKGTVVFAGPSYDLKAADRQAKAKQLLVASAKEAALEVRSAPAPDLRGLRWKALPGAAAEAEDVRRALQDSPYGPVQTYMGAEALEEVFKALRPPRLLHIASHGFFLPDPKEDLKDREQAALLGSSLAETGGLARLRKIDNPLLRSGIVLAGANALFEETSPAGVDDGWVTAEEIALMNLRGTELVVLSACETGLGDIKTGEGVYGLRRAFMYAGARTLVTSLFKVPDEQTRQMMRSFYGGLKAGNRKLAALHEAQLEMIRQRRQEHGAAHPFFWASFVLVGDPD
jgi:CHAT domain-containing protein/tetratricopeptide (TPR) repeat protein